MAGRYDCAVGDAIYLLGMMGSGKSTVGRRLAARIGGAFVDLDQFIELRESATVGELFAHGEAHFRAAELAAARVLADAVERGEAVAGIEVGREPSAPAVIALGGGAYLDARIRELAERGLTVYLAIEGPRLLARLSAEDRAARPFFASEDPFAAELEDRFLALYRERDRVYAQAQHHVDASQSPDQIVAQIMRFL